MSKSSPTQIQYVNRIDNIVEDTSISKSQRIRILYNEGFSKSQIALMLQIKYQFVRNVLLHPLKKS